MHRACIASSSYANFCFYCLPHLHFLMRTSLQFPVHCSPPRVLFLQRVPRRCPLLIVANSPVCGDLCCFAKGITQSENTVRESQLIIVTTPTHSRAQCALCSFFSSSKCFKVIHRERLGVVNCCQQPSVRRFLLFCKEGHIVVHREGVAVNNCHHPNTFKSLVCTVQFFSSKCYIVIHRERLGAVICCQLSSFKFPVFTSMCSAHLAHFALLFVPFCKVP